MHRAKGTAKANKRVFIENSDVRVKRMVRKAGNDAFCFRIALLLGDDCVKTCKLRRVGSCSCE
jgi:hypothetical protein